MNLLSNESNSNVIIFDASKKEKKLTEEFKVFQRKLKTKWKFIELVFQIYFAFHFKKFFLILTETPKL